MQKKVDDYFAEEQRLHQEHHDCFPVIELGKPANDVVGVEEHADCAGNHEQVLEHLVKSAVLVHCPGHPRPSYHLLVNCFTTMAMSMSMSMSMTMSMSMSLLFLLDLHGQMGVQMIPRLLQLLRVRLMFFLVLFVGLYKQIVVVMVEFFVSQSAVEVLASIFVSPQVLHLETEIN